jgi:transposase-like protein
VGDISKDVIIMLCVRWYLRYSLSYQDLKEIMAERGLSVDHVTIWRWAGRIILPVARSYSANVKKRLAPL